MCKITTDENSRFMGFYSLAVMLELAWVYFLKLNGGKNRAIYFLQQTIYIYFVRTTRSKYIGTTFQLFLTTI